MQMDTESGCSNAFEGILQAINRHDLDALVSCFAAEYHSVFPLHPDRTLRGLVQLRSNWSQIFHAVPDIHASLLRCATQGHTVWAEWEWTGTLLSGGPFLTRGVTIHGIEQGRTSWARLYMEPVQEGQPGIESLETSGIR